MSEALAQGEVGSVSISPEPVTEDNEPRSAQQLPEPKGYKLLIALPEPDEMTEGGILKAAKTLQDEEVGSIVGMVLKLGADAYNDPKRFPSGALCKEGDWILMRSYSGTRFKVHGKEFRLINDDSVEATVEDPRGIIKV
jgi:co-chaperonin GroES (HSP10)|tara:strand:- start:1255 stop:1671 length:417 start_codon:yes stop_codon:yes gene_type:complete